MRIDYEKLRDEIITALSDNRIWILSTSSDGRVSSRSMSIINKGLNVYFQTNKCYIKHKQMKENKNVALCFNNISIEGVAEEIGDWNEESNKELMELYKCVHPGSFKAYGFLEGQVVYKITPKIIKLWKYINGNPIRQYLNVDEKIAEQLDFM